MFGVRSVVLEAKHTDRHTTSLFMHSFAYFMEINHGRNSFYSVPGVTEIKSLL